MTREVAINVLKTHYAKNPRTSYGVMVKQATEMAIKALKQEQKSEWEHDNEILKAHSEGAREILDIIRAEIEQEPYVSKMEVLEIIDKYKEEKEGAEE